VVIRNTVSESVDASVYECLVKIVESIVPNLIAHLAADLIDQRGLYFEGHLSRLEEIFSQIILSCVEG
jgi:hypothetical protein